MLRSTISQRNAPLLNNLNLAKLLEGLSGLNNTTKKNSGRSAHLNLA